MMSKFIAFGAAALLAVQAIDIDCSAANCPETCSCSLSNCQAEVDACMGDADCAKEQDCAFQCPCGDKECALKCVGDTASPFAAPLFECVHSKCSTDLLSASAPAVDCGQAACQDVCTCSMDKCSSKVEACLAEADCSGAQTCALGCACGDEACLLACMQKTNSPLGTEVAECITSECPMVLLGAPNLSCQGSACEDSCQCAKSKCLGKGMACLLDPNCVGFQSCSFNCACGDAECATKCAEEQSSAKAMPLAQCIVDRCHQERNI